MLAEGENDIIVERMEDKGVKWWGLADDGKELA